MKAQNQIFIRDERSTTVKNKLNFYEEPKIEILALDVQDVITASNGNAFAGEEDDFSKYFYNAKSSGFFE